MKTFRIKFPRRVRIHGGECGAVARALHHAAQKEALMPYEQFKNSLISDECVLKRPADLEKSSISTFLERKQMSTKTSIKRIALVAVSALGFGLLSVAPSNAAVTGLQFTASVPVPTVTVGDTVNINFNIAGSADATETVTVGSSVVAEPIAATSIASSVVVSAYGALTNLTATSGAGTTLATYTQVSTDIAVTNGTFSFAAATAGTYQIKLTANATGATAIERVVSITVNPLNVANDAMRLSSVNAVRMVHASGVDTTGLPRDPVTVAAGGLLTDALNAGVVGTVKLRADLVTYPAGGYVSTTANTTAGTVVNFGKFNNTTPRDATEAGGTATSAVATSASNLVTITGTAFNPCTPTTATDLPRTYTAGVLTLGQTCDNVVAQAGNATDNLNGFGLGFFTFTPTIAGSYTLRVWQDVDGNGFVNPNGGEVFTDLIITVSAYSAFSTQESTAFINAQASTSASGIAAKGQENCFTADGVTAIAGFTLGTKSFVCDEMVLAPKGTVTSAAKVAVIKVSLKDALGVRLDSRSTFPVITATITGSGTLAVGSAEASVPVGRSVQFTPTSLLTNAGGPDVVYVTIFNDGTAISSESKIEIKVGTTVFANKSISFYGDVTKVVSSQGLDVLPAVAGPYGCVTSATSCEGTTRTGTVANSVAVQLLASDVNGTPVPYRSYSAVSSAPLVFDGILATSPSAGSIQVHTSGAVWFPVSVLPGPTTVSGATGTLTYSTNIGTATAPILVTADALTFALGGILTSATASLKTGATDIGQLNTLTITGKDAAGNKPYDYDYATSLKSDYAIQTALRQASTTLTGTTVPIWNGVGTIDFYNPIIVGTFNISGYVRLTTIPVSVALTTTAANPAADAAQAAADAAAEAIDAANAATDAANLAAEAADAATVAAEEARDAADAATAAVEELATQVATLFAALRAQLTTLANTVAKIAKKVRA
jgi:hypothetical protein